MSELTEEYRSCAVCGRTILRGERTVDYVDPAGAHAPVCVLCMPRAEASSWVPAGHARVAAPEQPARRRGGAALLERLQPKRGQTPFGDESEGETAPRGAIEVFNASDDATHKVAGLRRSLGEPRVSLRPGKGGAEVVTVAWELCWYQWSVEGERLRQVGKGNEISELPIADRDWTATAAEDGRLELV